jgi:hypothetical protein
MILLSELKKAVFQEIKLNQRPVLRVQRPWSIEKSLTALAEQETATVPSLNDRSGLNCENGDQIEIAQAPEFTHKSYGLPADRYS